MVHTLIGTLLYQPSYYITKDTFSLFSTRNICMEEVDFMAIFTVTPVDDITSLIDGTANPGDVILVEDGVYNNRQWWKNQYKIIAEAAAPYSTGRTCRFALY